MDTVIRGPGFILMSIQAVDGDDAKEKVVKICNHSWRESSHSTTGSTPSATTFRPRGHVSRAGLNVAGGVAAYKGVNC